MKEMWRKFLVALKRRPQMIPLVVLVIGFLQYSLNLMHVSDSTAKIQGSGMGLAGFATMLFSMLSLVCFMNAFPYRKKPNIPMMVLMYAMNAIVIFADVYYMRRILEAVTRADNPIIVTKATEYIATAYTNVSIHIGILCVGLILTVLLPVYSKWIRKINTSVEVAGSGNMAEIDISGEA